MAEIEDINLIIMGGVDQPVLNPHNLMVNVDKRPTIDELERQIGRLEHRNTYLKKKNEQLGELNVEFERACVLIARRITAALGGECIYCRFPPKVNGVVEHFFNWCPWAAVEKVLKLKAKFDTASKQLGGE